MQKGTLERLLRVAKGEAPADTIITNGRIVNVFTNSIEEHLTVSIKDGYITGIDKKAHPAASEKTEVVDAQGEISLPGLYRCPYASGQYVPLLRDSPLFLEGRHDLPRFRVRHSGDELRYGRNRFLLRQYEGLPAALLLPCAAGNPAVSPHGDCRGPDLA